MTNLEQAESLSRILVNLLEAAKQWQGESMVRLITQTSLQLEDRLNDSGESARREIVIPIG